MPGQYKTTDLEGKALAALPWEGGCKIEAIVRYTSLDEDTVRCALEDLVRRRTVKIDDRNYWRKSPWIDADADLFSRTLRQYCSSIS